MHQCVHIFWGSKLCYHRIVDSDTRSLELTPFISHFCGCKMTTIPLPSTKSFLKTLFGQQPDLCWRRRQNSCHWKRTPPIESACWKSNGVVSVCLLSQAFGFRFQPLGLFCDWIRRFRNISSVQTCLICCSDFLQPQSALIVVGTKKKWRKQ